VESAGLQQEIGAIPPICCSERTPRVGPARAIDRRRSAARHARPRDRSRPVPTSSVAAPACRSASPGSPATALPALARPAVHANGRTGPPRRRRLRRRPAPAPGSCRRGQVPMRQPDEQPIELEHFAPAKSRQERRAVVVAGDRVKRAERLEQRRHERFGEVAEVDDQVDPRCANPLDQRPRQVLSELREMGIRDGRDTHAAIVHRAEVARCADSCDTAPHSTWHSSGAGGVRTVRGA